MEGKRPTQIITLLPPERRSDSPSPVSPSPSTRRRRKATVTSMKSKEQLIMQSYQQLMDYVDCFDSQVKKVIASYQSSFLTAYRQHSKNVRQELDQIRKNSFQVMKDHQIYVDRIQYLEKQLILFRQESLKISELNIELNQQIKALNFQIKDLKQENSRLKSSLSLALKENKQTAVLLETLQTKKPNYKVFQGIEEISNLHKTIAAIQTTSSNGKQARPLSMSLRIKHRKILQSSKKTKIHSIQESGQDQRLQSSSQEANNRLQVSKTGSINDSRENKLKSEHLSQRKEPKRDNQKSNHLQGQGLRLINAEVRRLRSQQRANKNEYQKIFVECVQEVRKQIMRKSGITGINYFKYNGPNDFISFKTIDYHSLLYLFLKNDHILQGIFNLLFNSER